MKVSIGSKIIEGPWGGGNLFAINLKNYLENNGIEVVTDLKDDDIDIILMTEPRLTSPSSAFTHLDVYKYLHYVKRDSIVVHRVNECDEKRIDPLKNKRNQHFVNKYIIGANKVADFTIFVSTWLRDLYIKQGIESKKFNVILSGSDCKIFNQNNKSKWNKKDTLKIVTHHWGANWNKGFEYYLLLDNLIKKNYFDVNIEFTYIGNVPKNIEFKNTTLIAPLSGLDLAEKIKENHIYITGSINEPSGNHHIEAAQCGLPILFINSGGIPEYCLGYGEMFNETNFQEKLETIIRNYDLYFESLKNYDKSSEKMCKEYSDLFENLLQNKKEILKKRSLNFNKSKFSKKMYMYKNKFTK